METKMAFGRVRKLALVLFVSMIFHQEVTAQVLVCAGQATLFNINPCSNFGGWVIVNGFGTIILSTPTSALVSWTTSGTLRALNCEDIQVTVVSPPTGNITGPSQIACGNTSGYAVSYFANTNGANPTWTIPSGWTLLSGQGTGQIWVHPNGTAGNIQFTSGGSCIASFSKAVSVYTTPGALSISSTRGPASLCEPQSGAYFAFANGAASYSWTFSTSTGTVISSGQGVFQSDGYSSYWAYPPDIGSYRIKVVANPGSGCAQSSSNPVTMSLNVKQCGPGGLNNRIAVDETVPITFADGVSIFPNPASNFLHVNFDQPTLGASIKLISTNSSVHSSFLTDKQENQINIENISNGVYIVEIVKGTKITRKKVVVRQ